MLHLKSKKFLAATVGLTIGLTSAASASFLPSGSGLGGVFNSTINDAIGGAVGDSVGGAIGNSGGTFYDFGNVFSSGDGGFFGGILSGIEGLLGLNEGLTSPCGIIITNFDATNNGAECSSGVFDTIFEEVSGELGLPSEITGVLTGKNSVENVFSDIVNDALGQMGVSATDPSVVGRQGLPSPEGLLDALIAKKPRLGNVNSIGGNLPSEERASAASGNLATPGVNSTLTSRNDALRMLTQAVTDKGLSTKGQEITAARMTASQTISKASGKMGEASMKSAEDQMAAAVEMDGTIREQESTQDTLKEALSGMNLLQTQATQTYGSSEQSAGVEHTVRWCQSPSDF